VMRWQLASKQGAVGKITDPRKDTGESDLERMIVEKRWCSVCPSVCAWKFGADGKWSRKKKEAPTQEHACYVRYQTSRLDSFNLGVGPLSWVTTHANTYRLIGNS